MKIPPPPYQCAHVSLPQRRLNQPTALHAREHSLFSLHVGSRSLQSITVVLCSMRPAACAHPRCKKGKAHCKKCKSAHKCSQCNSGFRVGSTGACVAIPKPPPYKCAVAVLGDAYAIAHTSHAHHALSGRVHVSSFTAWPLWISTVPEVGQLSQRSSLMRPTADCNH